MDSGDFFQRTAALGRAHTELGGQPSKRQLAEAARRSHTTVDKWLFKGQFPKEIDPLLRIVRAIRIEAVRQGRLTLEMEELTDPVRWQNEHRQETARRAATTSTVMVAVSARRALADSRSGVLVNECDPVRLGVREGPDNKGLTRFVPRAHDDGLVDCAARGGVIALVGGSSTGKSRSAWEAVRALGHGWRLWQPVEWEELDLVGPHTVIWLNDARQHLTEEHAKRLLGVLSDRDRTPITVLCTLWPEDWRELTADPAPGEPHHHYWTQKLLTRAGIDIPDTFVPLNPDELAEAVRADDRWGRAIREPQQRVIQYFAGVPALDDKYRHGPVMVRSLIEAAMDARRLGGEEWLLRDFLVEAATGYPFEAEWAAVPGDWPGDALDDASRPVRGLPGPLHPEKPRTLRVAKPRAYRLAPYLEQLGRDRRAEKIPPESFWEAARQHLLPADWARLAERADRYGLFRIGARLRRAALDAQVAARPAELLRRVPDADHETERWLAANAPLTDLQDLSDLGKELAKRGAWDSRAALHRRAACRADLSSRDVGYLLDELALDSDATAIADFVARDPGGTLPLDSGLLIPLAKLDRPAAALLVQRLRSPEQPNLLATVANLSDAGFREEAQSIVGAMDPPADLDDLIRLLNLLHDKNFVDEIRRLLALGFPGPEHTAQAASLLKFLDVAGLEDQLSALIETINAERRLNGSWSWHESLLDGLDAHVRDRLRLDPREPSVTKTFKLYLTVEDEVADRAAGIRGMSHADAATAVDAVDLAEPMDVALLLRALRLDENHEVRLDLVGRIDPERLSIEKVGSLSSLALELGAGPIAMAIMKRIVAACAPWNSKLNRRIVIPTLQRLGYDDLLTDLASRISDAGDFLTFVALAPAAAARFPYGREPDREASRRWGWSDLLPV